jgi:hypothetical protein
MVQEITKEKVWLGVAGTIADYGYGYKDNIKYIDNFLKKYELNLDDYQKEVVFPLSDVITYFSKNLNKAFFKIQNIKSVLGIKKFKKYYKKIENEIDRQLLMFENNKEKIESLFFIYFIQNIK